MSNTSEKVLKSFSDVNEAQFNTQDDLLRGISFQDLIDAVQSNEKVKDVKSVKKVFAEMVQANIFDARGDLSKNIKRILKELE